MKRKLKGRKRYYPGSLYGIIFLMLSSIAAVFIMNYIIGTENLPMKSECFLIAILIIFLLVMAASMIGGIMFFEFTEKKIRQKLERKYEQEYETDSEQQCEQEARKKAKTMELIIGFVFILILTPVLGIMSNS